MKNLPEGMYPDHDNVVYYDDELKFNNPDINYWFTSDSHYYHKNIVKGVTKWKDKRGCRDFKDETEMSTNLVDEINKIVMPNDVLFHLGDWCFGGIQNIWNFRKRINCKNIYLCLGNHDQHIKKDKKLPNCWMHDTTMEIYEGDWEDNKLISVPCNARDLFKDVQLMYEIEVHGQKITLCHYSMQTWYYHNKGSWMLFGHSHDSLHPEGLTMDVGVDVAKRMLGAYRPFKFQELQKIMQNKKFVQVDGHSTNTNP